MQYFGKLILYMLLMFLPGFAIGFVFGFIGAAFSLGSFTVSVQDDYLIWSSIMYVSFYGISGFIYLRLSACLAGSAIGQPLGFRETWRKTSDGSAAFWLLSISFAVLTLLFSLSGAYATLPWQAAIVGQICWAWMQLIFGVSLITTLYGHYIEERPLRD